MDPYRRALPNGIVIASTRAEHAGQLEELQKTCFPTLSHEERFRAEHYLKHLELFPEGQFVALDGERVVGMASTVRLHFDFNHGDHTFGEISQGGYLTSHQPDGAWLYGADIGTHPEYRRLGIARGLYAAQQAVVRHFGLLGHVTVGMMSGYGSVRNQMTAEEYFAGLQAGLLVDPTVSCQLRVGFEIRGLLRNYLSDPVCDNCGVLLVLDASKDV